MKCPICGSENPSNAIYCKNCGSRLGERKTCRGCGEVIDADSRFCPYCGRTTKAQKPAKQANAGGTAVLTKITQSGMLLCSLLMAIVSLIFVFLIGIELVVPGSATLRANLYYYFGDAYAAIGSDLSGMTEFSGMYASGQYLSIVPITMLAAVALLGVTALSVIGIVQNVLQLTGKSGQRKNLSPFAFLAYLAAAILFLSITGGTANVSSGSSPTELVCSFDPVTKAGVALGSVFFILYAACRILPNCRQLFRKNMLSAVSAFCSAAVAVVIIALCSLPLATLLISSVYAGTASELSLLMLVSNLFATDASVTSFGAGNAGGLIALLFLIFLLHAAIVFIAFVTLYKNLFKTDPAQKGNAIKWNITLAVFAGATLLFGIVAESLFRSGIAGTGSALSFNIDYTLPVLILGFSLILLLINIIRNVALSEQAKQSAVLQQERVYAYTPNAQVPAAAAAECAVTDGDSPSDTAEEEATPSRENAEDAK